MWIWRLQLSLTRTLALTLELFRSQIEDFDKEAAEAKKLGIIEPNESLVRQLLEMGFGETMARRALVASKNVIDEAMEVCFQQQDAEPEPDPQTVKDDKKKKLKRPRLIPLELQRLFTSMKLLNQKAISTEGLHTVASKIKVSILKIKSCLFCI